METFVARQPILDRNKKVVAYELLFRGSYLAQTCDAADGTRATSQVVADSLLSIGVERLLCGKPAFINFTRELLVSGYAGVLPPQLVVIEVLETIEPDPEVIDACRKLRQQGYGLALDDYEPNSPLKPLVPHATVIKVDFRKTTPAQQDKLVKAYRPRGIRMLAEKVETEEEYERARASGYSYFQGYFFARPAVIRAKQPPAFAVHYQDLLRVVLAPEFDLSEVEGVLKREISLVYKLLRFLNSARFGWWSKIESIRHALVLLGKEEIRKWVSLAILAELSGSKPRALVMTGMVRARFCELMAPLAGQEYEGEKLFLTGMFSVMDALTERSMRDVVDDLHMDAEVSSALLDLPEADSVTASIYRLARAYEAGEWGAVSELAGRLNVSEEAIPGNYLSAVRWAEEIW